MSDFKIDFGELLIGFIIGFMFAGWLCVHAFNETTAESCQKQGSMIIDHQIYSCSKKL